ncbi:MAG: DUF2723 domain-containing protein [bacterium]
MALFVFFVSLFVYLFTLTPSIGLHDSGDMTTASWILGICHPTGYPFYMILGKAFSSLIPIGSIAFRMNFLSSIFASLCVMITYFITLKLIPHLKSRIPSIISSLTLAFSTRFWEQAIIAEKYTLNGFFFSLLTLLLIKRKWLLFSFFLGLSFTHHTQTMFLLPGTFVFILITLLKHKDAEKRHKGTKAQRHKIIQNSKEKIQNLFKMAFLFILPLFLWFYLPIRASCNPELNWNMPKDITGFTQHITGFGYTGLFFLPTFIKVLGHLKDRVFPFFLSQFTIIPLIFALIGLFLLFKKNILFFFFCLLTIIFNIYMAIGYNIPNIEDYYIPSFIYISIFVGFCFSVLPKKIPFFCLLIPLIPLITHFNFCNRRNYYIIYDHTLALMDSLKKDSISLYTMDYNIFPLWYLEYVEKRRGDISPILYPYFHQDWTLFRLLQDKPYLNMDRSPSRDKPLSELDAILKKRFETLVLNNPNTPIYLDFKGWIPQGFIYIPSGFVFRILPFNCDIEKELTESIPNFRARKLNETREWRTKMMVDEYSKAYNERGSLYNILGRHNEALDEYLKAIELEKNNPVIYRNLGRTYAVLGKYNEGERALKNALSIKEDYADCYSDLSIIYLKLNKREKAISSLKKALQIDPNHSEAKKNLLILQKNKP